MFFLALGTVGAMELDALPFFEGVARAIFFTALWVLFTFLAGGFEKHTERMDKHEVQTANSYPYSSRADRQSPAAIGRETHRN